MFLMTYCQFVNILKDDSQRFQAIFSFLPELLSLIGLVLESKANRKVIKVLICMFCVIGVFNSAATAGTECARICNVLYMYLSRISKFVHLHGRIVHSWFNLTHCVHFFLK